LRRATHSSGYPWPVTIDHRAPCSLTIRLAAASVRRG
jgi:hypothetical protein